MTAGSSFKVGGDQPIDRRYQRKQKLVWTGFPFAANCSNFAGGFQLCQYRIDTGGVVHLRGLMKYTGTPSNPQVIGTLPAGYRPLATELFLQSASYTGGNIGLRVDIDVVGAVRVNSSSGVAWDGADCSLSGITYATT